MMGHSNGNNFLFCIQRRAGGRALGSQMTYDISDFSMLSSGSSLSYLKLLWKTVA